MPKLTDAQQEERRARILDAAERCFTRSGFHRTTMQDICKEAGVSPGALYTWFDSKEALIGGISARDRDEVLASFAPMVNAEDLLGAMADALAACVLNRPREKSVLCLEIAAESTRNPRVAEVTRRMDDTVRESLGAILRRAEAEGRIAPAMPIPDLLSAMTAIAEGLFWRRAVDPNFDAVAAGRAFVAMVGAALRPAPKAGECGADKQNHGNFTESHLAEQN